MDVNAASASSSSSSSSSCTTPETEDPQFDDGHHERAPLLLPTKIMDAADEKGERPDLSEDTAHQISVGTQHAEPPFLPFYLSFFLSFFLSCYI
jgi:hypothetical protein